MLLGSTRGHCGLLDSVWKSAVEFEQKTEELLRTEYISLVRVSYARHAVNEDGNILLRSHVCDTAGM